MTRDDINQIKKELEGIVDRYITSWVENDKDFLSKAPERIVALVKRIEELEDEQTKAN